MRKIGSEQAVQVWARLIRVQQHLLQKVEDDLAAADLPSLAWYDVLLELDRPGVDRLRHRDLQQRLLLAKYNLSRLVDRMEVAGLLRRQAADDDARGTDIVITEAGRALRRRMWPIYRDAIDRHFASRLDDRDVESFGRILLRLA